MGPLDSIRTGVPLLAAGPTLGLASDLGIGLVLARLALPFGTVPRQLLGFLGGGLLCLATAIHGLRSAGLGAADFVGYLILASITYGALGFCLFNLVHANVSSVRVRLLKEYARAHPRPLTDAELFVRYSAREILEIRLRRLERGGQITRVDDRYYPRNGSVQLMGAFFGFLRKLLLRD